MLKDAITSIVLLATWIACHPTYAGEPEVNINTDFPGGNIIVDENRGNEIEVRPRLDGGRDWFYWYFEATAQEPGKVEFQFPSPLSNRKNGAVGFQGPAVSYDKGETWEWMGTDTAVVQGKSFRYTFKKAGESVRFSVTIPYLQPELDAFVKRHEKNPHLSVSYLNRTPQGRKVELIQIGEPHPGATPTILTARHHANETIASFFLEGFMEAALSDTPEGDAFREKYVLYVVPFVDKDGCENGDQGKGRTPHDHNRDYGPNSIYPTIQAIMELAEAKDIQVSMDFHCPKLVNHNHQVFYFVGPSNVPSQNHEKVNQLANRMKSELPTGSPGGPDVRLTKRGAEGQTMNSGFFAHRPGALMAATIEVPFAPKNTIMTQDAIRSYGAAMLRAWNETDIVTTDFSTAEKP